MSRTHKTRLKTRQKIKVNHDRSNHAFHMLFVFLACASSSLLDRSIPPSAAFALALLFPTLLPSLALLLLFLVPCAPLSYSHRPLRAKSRDTNSTVVPFESRRSSREQETPPNINKTTKNAALLTPTEKQRSRQALDLRWKRRGRFCCVAWGCPGGSEQVRRRAKRPIAPCADDDEEASSLRPLGGAGRRGL